MLKDFFTVKAPALYAVPVRTLDYEKVVELSAEDFAKLHLELMNEYKDKDGWWSDGKIPNCSECHSEIPGPEDLVRYYGRSLHHNCFRRVYEREGDETGIMKRYWDRVAELVLVA